MNPPEPLPDDEQDPLPSFGTRALLKRIAPYYSSHRASLLLAGALLLLVIGLGLLAPLFLGQIIDLATDQGQAGGRPIEIPVSPDESGLVLLAGLFVGVIILAFVLEACLGFVMARVGIAMVVQLKEDLFRKVLTLDPGFFRDYPPGRLIARVESDTEALKGLFSVVSLQMLRAVLSFLGIFACMLLFDAATTLAVLPVFVIIVAGTVVFLRIVRKYFHQSRRNLAAIAAHVTEFVQGIEVVQHFDYGDAAQSGLEVLNRKKLRADCTADFLSYGFWGLVAFGELLCAALILWVGVEKVLAGTMTIGTLVVFLEYLRQVFLPIQHLSEFVSEIQRGFVSAGRIFGILSLETATPDRPNAKHQAQLTTRLAVEDVRFTYPTGQDEVLRGVSFALPRGEKVALVGPSGGGKSTIVKLLLGFYEPTAGRITLDGQDAGTWTRAARRDLLGLVPQDVFLFPGTLGENITVFDDLPRADVEAACRTVQADKLIESLPGGLDAPLSERGANLSHGERQLVSLARALAHGPQLLILDEATSSVDPHTEARIQEALERLLQDRTALIVAHRLSTIRQCDAILVVDGGRIVERGTHDELWEAGGLYRSLAELQLASAGSAS